jgi:hypothetical protein
VQALEDLKHHLHLPPILTAPLPGENLLTSPRLLTSQVQPSRWSTRRKAMHLVCSDRCILSAKSSLNLRFVTHQFKNFSMLYSSLPVSFVTTSMNTRSQLSLISHWRIYSIIGTPLDASPSEQWNWELSASISSLAPLSNHKH